MIIGIFYNILAITFSNSLSIFLKLEIIIMEIVYVPINLFASVFFFFLQIERINFLIISKSVRIRSFSGPYFPAFGLNTERYSLSLRIQSECGKIRTTKTPNTVQFQNSSYKKTKHAKFSEKLTFLTPYYVHVSSHVHCRVI